MTTAHVAGKQVQTFTIISYMSCLRNALNTAVREDIISENPINKLSVQDKIYKGTRSKREFLTIDELKKVEETENPHKHIKQAFLFACYCVWRYSDIRQLRWKDLIKDGDQWRLNKLMQKTGTPIYLPYPRKPSAGSRKKVT